MTKAATIKLITILFIPLLLQSCHHGKKLYKSDCDMDKTFKHVTFTHLMDSLEYYNNQFVEIRGKYEQDKEFSALLNEAPLGPRKKDKALWVEFSPECPLYLEGTRIGFFDYDYNGGKLTPANNQTVIIHGVVNAHYKGHAAGFDGSIGHISFIQL